MKVSVIVPSLDPDEKLMEVVRSLLAAGFNDIILVNDGSHADHLSPFTEAAAFPEVTVLTHEVNKGKGRAMKTAFQWCIENRPEIDGVVTVDGDNQHRAKDVLAVSEAMAKDPSKLWLGVRNFAQEDVPFRSRFGNKLTRSIVKLACGTAFTDTQTGLRAIPLRFLPFMMTIEGERYEYETEMLLSLKKGGMGIGEIVIDTVYIDENQTSHFNPLRDSWKIYKIIFRHMFRELSSFLKFSASSISCFILDAALFTLFNQVVFKALSPVLRSFSSTYGARAISSVTNYSLNRKLVFKDGGSISNSMLRYFTLVIVQAAVSAGLLSVLKSVLLTTGFADTIVKVLLDCILFLVSYKIQKRWVFSGK